MKIAVCVHLYHTDMWGEIQKYLDNLKHKYDLYVNFPLNIKNGIPVDLKWEEYYSLYDDLKISLTQNQETAIQHWSKYGKNELRHYLKKYYDVESQIKKYKNDVKIIFTENKGMDIGGFLQTYKYVDPSTDYILKIHTKRSIGAFEEKSFDVGRYGFEKAEKIGLEWFHDMMNSVLGDENKINLTIQALKNNNCGMTGYKKYNNYKKNYVYLEEFRNFLNIKIDYNNNFFIGGTIFWIENSILKKHLTPKNIEYLLSKLKDGYSYEPSYAHAMERIFGYLVYNENKEIIVIN